MSGSGFPFITAAVNSLPLRNFSIIISLLHSSAAESARLTSASFFTMLIPIVEPSSDGFTTKGRLILICFFMKFISFSVDINV